MPVEEEKHMVPYAEPAEKGLALEDLVARVTQ